MCSRQESPATNLCPGSADDAKGCLGTASRSQKLLRLRSGVRFLHTQCEGIALSIKLTVFVCSRQESNLHQSLRRGLSYPLNDESDASYLSTLLFSIKRFAYHSQTYPRPVCHANAPFLASVQILRGASVSLVLSFA